MKMNVSSIKLQYSLANPSNLIQANVQRSFHWFTTQLCINSKVGLIIIWKRKTTFKQSYVYIFDVFIKQNILPVGKMGPCTQYTVQLPRFMFIGLYLS